MGRPMKTRAGVLAAEMKNQLRVPAECCYNKHPDALCTSAS